MNLSSFDQVIEYVTKLRQLEAVRDAVQFNQLTVTVAVNYSGTVDIADLTSFSDCRRVLGELLDESIVGVKRALATYNVDVDK